jgi:hypothetical protein
MESKICPHAFQVCVRPVSRTSVTRTACYAGTSGAYRPPFCLSNLDGTCIANQSTMLSNCRGWNFVLRSSQA